MFGTNFFAILDSSPNQFHAVKHWWILPVSILISTALTFGFYFMWQKRRELAVMQAVDEEGGVGTLEGLRRKKAD